MSADLLYSEDEEQLRAAVRSLLDRQAPTASVLARAESGEPYDPALWRSLGTEMGVAGLAVPVAAGGAGGSWREVSVVAEELGRVVAGTPFLGSAVLASAAVLSAAAAGTAATVAPGDRDRTEADDPDRLLAELASGARTASLALAAGAPPGGFPDGVRWDGAALTGAVHGVLDAAAADVLLVPARTEDGDPVLVRALTAAEVVPVTSLDLTRPLSDLRFGGAPGTVLAAGDAARGAVDAARTAGCAVLAAEQVGLAQRCLELSVEYLKTRYQFGRPIGSFQALKHRCADQWAAITQARAVARYAADCLAADSAATAPDTAVAAALAQAYCGPVAVRAAEECVQLHGGIGFTWEHPAHLYLKRAKADALLFGSAARHRARLAELVDLPAG